MENENNIRAKTVAEITSGGITMDKIIEKFIPIIGALFLIIGLGYLLYTTAWINLPVVARLGLGFFLSIVIIGGSFSFSEKLRYFTDLGIGSGVLLFYGTLIYGSRTSEVAEAIFPETATLITALIFVVIVSYFASKRNSKVIITLGMLGAYITPFVIGQNDVWAQNISFNSYLMYFIAINVAVFLLGREISVRNIIPLNIIGLFAGTSFLYRLSYMDGISKVAADNFYTSEIFTAILFLLLVVFSTWSILLSAKQFEEKDEGYLALGYLAPLLWFIGNLAELKSITNITEGSLFLLYAITAFVGWHYLKGTKTRFQHISLYAVGLVSLLMAFFAFIPEFNVYTSIAVAYLSLEFGFVYMFYPEKKERLFSYGVISFIGAVLSFYHILNTPNLSYETVHIVVALIPAMLAFFIVRPNERAEYQLAARYYSLTAFLVAILFIVKDIIEYIDLQFLLFYIGPIITLGYLAFFGKKSESGDSHEVKSNLLRITLIWFALGYISVFLDLIANIYPAPTDTFIFTHANQPTDWILYKGIFATLILFFGLRISRNLQAEQESKRPSFILVIFGFASLVLIGNYIIYAMMNDLAVSMAQGGPRAIVTTIWWILIALYMLIKGVRHGVSHHAEKLLGLILLVITIGKILLYDLATMVMQNKVFILMIVGGALLLFSYGIQARGWLGADKEKN